MLFSVLRDNTIDKVDKRLALDYYNNFRVKISYPTEIIIEGKFIIGKNNGDYEFNSYDCDDFIFNDFLQSNYEQVKSSNIVFMISLETCMPVLFFDDFLQDGDQLENGKILQNAEYWRILPPYRQECKKFHKVHKMKNNYKRIII